MVLRPASTGESGRAQRLPAPQISGYFFSMPTYEYRCQKGHEFEVFQRMSEDPLDKCIHCGARAERLLSAGALLFKGSGFYITDNRSDSYKKAAEAESKPKPSESSAESKPKPSESSKKPDTGKSSSGSE
jgi:putative FmdB family regulatory protein